MHNPAMDAMLISLCFVGGAVLCLLLAEFAKSRPGKTRLLKPSDIKYAARKEEEL